MSNKIIVLENGIVSVRLDGAFTTNEKHLVEAYITDEDKKRFFGSFKFLDPKETEKTLKRAVKETKLDDTVFSGSYPKWNEDEFGLALTVNNRVKFYQKLGSTALVPDDSVRDYVYALEVHLKKNKDGGIFLAVARAIVTGKSESGYNNDLFDDMVAEDGIEIAEDDLPF